MLVAAGVVTVLVSACSAPQIQSAPSTSQPAPVRDLDRFYSQQLEWDACGGDECTSLLVPVDYSHPEGVTIELAVRRHPAERVPRGVVVVNPGGPGASGYDYADYADQLFSARLTNERDIVGFDPRGVGRSAPVTCGDDELADRFVGTDATPDTPAEVEEISRVSTEFVAACTATPSNLLMNLSTVDTARDLDVLRAALGQTTLDYLGVSYGTHLGATYARLFPESVGRFVLDAPVPAGLDALELSMAQAAGFEDSLTRFILDCQTHSDCPLGSTPDAESGRMILRQLLDDLDQSPANTDEPERPLTEAAATYAILMGLYTPRDRGALRDGLASLAVGDGEPLQRFLDQRLRRESDGGYADNSLAAFVAVTCSDRQLTSSVADIDVDTTQAPFLGEYISWGAEPCAIGAFEPRSLPEAAGQAPAILVVATTHDPATPLPFAALLVDELGDAVLVTRDGDGHTAYREGSSCIDTAIDDFLLTGVLPPDGLMCA